MPETNHTPGPWLVHKDGISIYHVPPQKWMPRENICRAAPNFYMKEVRRANAKLIAAAPDLLDKLQKALDRLEELNETSHYLVQEIEEAIKKATL